MIVTSFKTKDRSNNMNGLLSSFTIKIIKVTVGGGNYGFLVIFRLPSFGLLTSPLGRPRKEGNNVDRPKKYNRFHYRLATFLFPNVRRLSNSILISARLSSSL